MTEALICPKCHHDPAKAEAGDRCPRDGTALVWRRHWQARPHDPLLGRVLGGKYAVVGFVAEGGFGSVYRAIQEPVGRQVAVKCLAESQQGNEDLRQRFFREARVVARLNHPSTVVLHDYGEEPDGRLFMVFELVEGQSLVDVLRNEAPLPPRRAVLLMRGVLGALSEAHAEGLVHRDLKPSNIMVVRGSFGEDEVKVLDFGIAKLVGGEGPRDRLRTRQGLVLGTPHYMAPEQARGDDVDHRSDLYAVGVLLYEALTGRPPFDAPSDIAVLMAQIQQPVPVLPPGLDVPPALAAVVERALQKKPADRFQSAEEMAGALLRSVDLFGTLPPPGDEGEARPTALLAPTRRASAELEATSAAMSALAPEATALDRTSAQLPALAPPESTPAADAEFGLELTEQVDLPDREAAPQRSGRHSAQLRGERVSRPVEAPEPRRRARAVAAVAGVVAAGAASAWLLSRHDEATSAADQSPVVVGITIAPPDAGPAPEPAHDAPPPLPTEPYARAVELARRNELDAAELELLKALREAADRAALARRVRADATLRDVAARPEVQTALAGAER